MALILDSWNGILLKLHCNSSFCAMNFFTESFSCYHYSENHSADQYLSFLLHDAFQVDLWAQEM